MRPMHCTWVFDDVHGMYETECNQGWNFVEGDLKDNKTKFCPYCGGRILVRKKMPVKIQNGGQ